MELNNATEMTAGYTLGVEPSGREHLVVVVKGTFAIPDENGEPHLLAVQQPLLTADTFTGAPGFSAPHEEVDFALRKRRCDVLLTGSAYAPEGEPTTRVTVGLRVGEWRKVFAVIGDRHWKAGLTGTSASSPAAFLRKSISYDAAFGGIDKAHEDPSKHCAFMRNPVGCGWHRHLGNRYVDGTPLPNTEEIDRPVQRPDGDYEPMSFGPLGRNWATRLPYAGTYDQQWLDETFPFLPRDFSDDYFQAAPRDQQLPFLRGGEEVMLLNLTPSGRVSFRLPSVDVPVSFFRRDGTHETVSSSVDTLAFQPDQRRFTMTWRASLPLRKNIFELVEVLTGAMPRGWWRARELGKAWYADLAELASEAKNAEDED